MRHCEVQCQQKYLFIDKKAIDKKEGIVYTSVQTSMSLRADIFRVEPVVTQPAPPQIRTYVGHMVM